MKSRKNQIKTTAISYLKEFQLNGINQKVLIEGKSSYNPVLICLHGLGTSIPFTCGSRGLFPELIDKYTMVYWDQLGTGINNGDISSYTVDDYVTMTIDLVKEVRQLFPNDKIYLLGISWGSLLTLKVMANSDCVDGAVTYGQICNNLYFSDEAFNAINDYCHTKKVLENLEKLEEKEVYEYKDVVEISKYISKYTNGFKHKDTKNGNFIPLILGNLLSPDYKLKDFKSLFKNGFNGNYSFIDELILIDQAQEFSKINKPYYIIQGADDLITPAKYLEETLETINNKNIRLNIIEKASHIPSTTAMDSVFGQLEQCVKEENI